MKHCQIILPTTNKETFGQFLCEILENDFEITKDNRLSFTLGEQRFCMDNSNEGKKVSSLTFEFLLSKDDVEDLKKRAEFFSYRFTNTSYEFISTEHSLVVIDDCGRKWSFYTLCN